MINKSHTSELEKVLDSVSESREKERLKTPELAQNVHMIIEFISLMTLPVVLIALFFYSNPFDLYIRELVVSALLLITLFSYLIINFVRFRHLEKKIQKVQETLERTFKTRANTILKNFLIARGNNSDRGIAMGMPPGIAPGLSTGLCIQPATGSGIAAVMSGTDA